MGSFWAWRRVKQVNIVLLWSFCIVCGILAVMAGPASATLLIPRDRDYPVGGAVFWLNGTADTNWPSVLDEAYDPGDGCSSEEDKLTNTNCPAAGFRALYDHYSRAWNWIDNTFTFEYQDFTTRRDMYIWPARNPAYDSWAYVPHVTTVRMQDLMRSLHSKAINYLAKAKPSASPWPVALRWATSKTYKTETRVPAVRTLCVSHGRVDLEGSELVVNFVDLLEDQTRGRPDDSATADEVDWSSQRMDVLDTVRDYLSRRDIASTDDDTLDEERLFNGTRRILAVPVPIAAGGLASSLGLVLLLNRTVEGSTDDPANDINLATCSIDARWIQAKSIFQGAELSSFLEFEYYGGRARNLASLKIDDDDKEKEHYMGPIPLYLDKPPDKRPSVIRLMPGWYDQLAPMVSSEDGSYDRFNQTTVERILDVSMVTDGNYLTQVQHTVSSIVADGISRCGMGSNLEPRRLLGSTFDTSWAIDDEAVARTLVRSGKPRETFGLPAALRDGDSVRMDMRAVFKGKAMVMTNWFEHVCAVILLSHAIIAGVHTVFMLRYGESSSAWRDLVELVALALRSPPPDNDALANTSVGADSIKTMSSIAWVEAESVETELVEAESTDVEVEDKSANNDAGTRVLRLRVQECSVDKDVRTAGEVERNTVYS